MVVSSGNSNRDGARLLALRGISVAASEPTLGTLKRIFSEPLNYVSTPWQFQTYLGERDSLMAETKEEHP